MSAGWIKTEEQRQKHLEGCRRRHREKVAADPDYNRKKWSGRMDGLREKGDEAIETHRVGSRAKAKRHYMRNRDQILRPDQTKREAVIATLGGVCVRCGFNADVRALVLDHKDGDGYLDRLRVGNRIARHYVNNLEEAKQKLQVLCCNCNAIKAIENHEHNRSRRIQ